MDETAIQSILANLIPQLQALWTPLILTSYSVGFLLLVVGFVLLGFSTRGGGGRFTFGHAAAAWVGSALLLNVGGVLNTLSWSLFARDSLMGLSYVPPSSDGTEIYVQFGVYLVMLIGLFGVIRGGYLITQIGQEPRMFGMAMTHLLGGTAAVNIVTVLNLFGTSLGGVVQTEITGLIGS